MNAKLRARLKKLEAHAQVRVTPALIQYGWITRLADDYVGQRHVVVIERQATRLPNMEWFVSEEGPGPAPTGARTCD